jgi:hypothetical protein
VLGSVLEGIAKFRAKEVLEERSKAAARKKR